MDPATLRQQQQQRPSLSYLLVLSLIFFLVSNNGGGDAARGRDPSVLEQLRSNLHAKQARLLGLSHWLAIEPNRTQLEANSSLAMQPFQLSLHSNPTLVQTLDRLLKRQEEPRPFYHHNLTGFVKGDWDPGHWDLAQLGLDEVYNTTTQREESLPEREERIALEKGPNLVPRQVDVAPPVEPLNGTALPVLVNVTTSSNRTTARASFPFLSDGKVSFNLREEQSSAVGPIIPFGPQHQAGDLLQLRPPEMEWENEGPVTWLKGDVTLTSKAGEDFVLDVEGVHFGTQGLVYAYLSPATLPSHIMAVPSIPNYDNSSITFPRRNRTANAAGNAVLKELERRIASDERDIAKVEAGGNLALRENEGTTGPLCTFLLYGSIDPLPQDYTQAAYIEYTSSLFHPTGSSLSPPPPAQLHYTLYSETCGLVLSGRGSAISSARLWTRASTFGVLMGVVQMGICWFLVKQMEWGSGVGMAVKVSYACVGMQAIIDCYFFVICFTVGLVTNNRASLPLLVPAFFALISSLLFGMSYASSIRTATPPSAPRPVPAPVVIPTPAQVAADAAERRASATEGEPVTLVGEEVEITGEPEEQEEDSNAPLLVIPVTSIAVPLTRPLGVVPSNGDDAFYLWIGGSCAVAGLTIIMIWGWIAFITVVLYSYWVPQIVHNVQRGAARMALRREYVLGMTVLRLVLPMYIWGCPSNILSIEASRWSLVLALYQFSLCTILLLQDSRLGARFFLTPALLSYFNLHEDPIWDYHPLLPPSDLESLRESTTCPICFDPILFELNTDSPSPLTGGGGGTKGRRWGYMVPPCEHLAHTECLERWLAIKSLCPVCRRHLPPL